MRTPGKLFNLYLQMKNRKPNRVATPQKTEALVLTKSRRRCAICFGLNTDLGVKPVQIAHVDHDPSNWRLSNLAALCPVHHDEYDTKRGQTKGFQPKELLAYRDGLYDVLDKRNRNIVAVFVDPQGVRATHPTNAARLGEIIEAFDEDSCRKNRSNGIRLANLGCTFASEYGDFTATREAVRALCKLCEDLPATEIQSASHSLNKTLDLPHASPLTGIVQVRIAAAEVDCNLSVGLFSQLIWRALYGETTNFKAFDLEKCPGAFAWPAIMLFGGVAWGVPRPSPKWMIDYTLQSAGKLFANMSVSYRLRGFDIPDSINGLYLSASGDRVRPGKGYRDEKGTERPLPPGRWPPDEWYSCLNALARLPDSHFEKVVVEVPSSRHDWSELLSCGEDGHVCSAEEAIGLVNAWSVSPGVWICGKIALRSQDDLLLVQQYTAHSLELGNIAVQSASRALNDEHRLIWRRNSEFREFRGNSGDTIRNALDK